MQQFAWNLFLAFVWAAAIGQLTTVNLVVGFLLGYLVLQLTSPITGSPRYLTKLFQFVGFALFYFQMLVLANLRVAYDVVTPTPRMRPAVIAVPLRVRTDAEITILAALIALTPGSLGLDLSEDRKLLFVHTMYLDNDDAEAFRRHIKFDLERRVIRLLR